MSDSDEFGKILKVVAFLALIWFFGRACKLISLSPLIGWIAAGMVFGPESPVGLIDDNEKVREQWKLLGTLGVTLLIAESGTHIHFEKIKKVGVSAVFVALIGTFLPLLFGFGLVLLFGMNCAADYTAAFAVGCAMAPTSVGVALKLLTEANELNSLSGQLIVTAAFLDDVFSIILLVILQSLDPEERESTAPWDFLLSLGSKFLFCFLFLALGVVLAMYLFGGVVGKLLHRIPSYDALNYQPRDEVHLAIMLVVLVSYSIIGDRIGSHLLGAFIAGMSFSQVSRSMYVWRRQMKRLCQWLIKLFFSCSVAFTIPMAELFSLEALAKGLCLSVTAGVAGKLASGFVCPRDTRWTVGFAMVGRGEFAYLVAATAKDLRLLDKALYAAVVWALLIAVIVAPMAFGYVLGRKQRAETARLNPGDGVKWFTIKAEAKHHTGVHFEVVDVLHNLKLDILEAKVETDGDTDCSEFVVGVGGKNDFLSRDKIGEILHDIREAVGDTEAMVQLLPIDEETVQDITSRLSMTWNRDDGDDGDHGDDGQRPDADSPSENEQSPKTPQPAPCPRSLVGHEVVPHGGQSQLGGDWLIEVKLMTVHSPSVFAKLVSQLEVQGVSLVRGHLEDFSNTDSHSIFGRLASPKLQGDAHHLRLPPTTEWNPKNIRDLKERLKAVLRSSNIAGGQMLVKRIHREHAVLPKHVKFSELLQMGRNQNNPLLSSDQDAANGFEVDVECSHYIPFLVQSISSIFELLDLDIRTIDAQILENEGQHFVSSFFVQRHRRSERGRADSASDREKGEALRHRIECHIAEIFRKQNVAATIKTKRIEMGSKHSVSAATTVRPRDSAKPPALKIADAKRKELPHAVSSPKSLSHTAQITESVVIITPKAQLAMPPSIEKQQLTLNVIGVLDNGQIAVSRQSTVDIITEDHPRCADDGGDADSASRSRSAAAELSHSEPHSARSSCSIIEILHDAAPPL